MSEPFNIRFKYVVDCYRTCASSSVEISETESTFSMQTLARSDQNRTKAFFLRSKKVITAVFMAITRTQAAVVREEGVTIFMSKMSNFRDVG